MQFSMPAEWEPHKACWVAWPSHAELWGEEELVEVQKEFVELCRAISYAPSGSVGEALCVLAPNPMRAEQARQALSGLEIRVFEIGFGDIWLRDTGPLFLRTPGAELKAGCFIFNGWGEKFNLRYDDEVNRRIAEASGYDGVPFSWVLEGGSIEVDGEGTVLTTEQCLLNVNRNRSFSREEVEKHLIDSLGVKKVLWLYEGLLNDHTDGHIDTLARFVAPGKVVCMAPADSSDPNASVLNEIKSDLEKMSDARGRKLQVHTITSPGKVLSEDGQVLPASYVNFYISNHSVVVPTYGTNRDALAIEQLRPLFPGRKVIGCPASTLLQGGGAFHCITQQEPKRT